MRLHTFSEKPGLEAYCRRRITPYDGDPFPWERTAHTSVFRAIHGEMREESLCIFPSIGHRWTSAKSESGYLMDIAPLTFDAIPCSAAAPPRISPTPPLQRDLLQVTTPILPSIWVALRRTQELNSNSKNQCRTRTSVRIRRLKSSRSRLNMALNSFPCFLSLRVSLLSGCAVAQRVLARILCLHHLRTPRPSQISGSHVSDSLSPTFHSHTARLVRRLCGYTDGLGVYIPRPPASHVSPHHLPSLHFSLPFPVSDFVSAILSSCIVRLTFGVNKIEFRVFHKLNFAFFPCSDSLCIYPRRILCWCGWILVHSFVYASLIAPSALSP
ncbi:hypothetical protein C8R43DRAFT_367184 [Mycena crocata]|nr:hypothetical protein C8R43DRAFT_367184 [Mycena crocata]